MLSSKSWPKFVRIACAIILAALVLPAPARSQAPIAGVAPLRITVQEQALVAVGYRASKLLGAPVYNDKNQKVGTIADLVITPKQYVSFVIVAVGGFLGIGAKDVAINANRFRGLNSKIILPGATKDALTKLPRFVFAQ
jgi:sporulation protein YlmC with PRC-barrel domain